MIKFFKRLIYKFLNKKKDKELSIYLDDVRPVPEGFTFYASTVERCKYLMQKFNIEFISFDHDLGMDQHGRKRTAMEIVDWIDERVYRGVMKPPRFTIHSANPVGRRNIERAMNRITERYYESKSK